MKTPLTIFFVDPICRLWGNPFFRLLTYLLAVKAILIVLLLIFIGAKAVFG